MQPRIIKKEKEKKRAYDIEIQKTTSKLFIQYQHPSA